MRAPRPGKPRLRALSRFQSRICLPLSHLLRNQPSRRRVPRLRPHKQLALNSPAFDSFLPKHGLPTIAPMLPALLVRRRRRLQSLISLFRRMMSEYQFLQVLKLLSPQIRRWNLKGRTRLVSPTQLHPTSKKRPNQLILSSHPSLSALPSLCSRMHRQISPYPLDPEPSSHLTRAHPRVLVLTPNSVLAKRVIHCRSPQTPQPHTILHMRLPAMKIPP